MELGNIIKVIEIVKHNKSVKKKITIGKVIAVDSTLTIKRIHDGKEDWNISYSIGDLKDISKKFYLQDAEGWKRIKFSVKEGVYNGLSN
jgi:hypothetical protein